VAATTLGIVTWYGFPVNAPAFAGIGDHSRRKSHGQKEGLLAAANHAFRPGFDRVWIEPIAERRSTRLQKLPSIRFRTPINLARWLDFIQVEA